MNKVLKIEKKVPKEVTLPDGSYIGTWCGTCITLKVESVEYELTVATGIRGLSKVVVTIEEGIGTYKEIANG